MNIRLVDSSIISGPMVILINPLIVSLILRSNLSEVVWTIIIE